MPLVMNPRESLTIRRKRPKRIAGNRAPAVITRQIQGILAEQVRRYALDAQDKAFWDRPASDVIADIVERQLKAQGHTDAVLRGIIATWITEISVADRIALERKLAKALQVKDLQIVDPPTMPEVLSMMNYEANTSIDSIISDYFNGARLAVARNFEGLPHPAGRSLVEQIQFLEHHAYERCQGMGRDQTNKVHAVITQERQTGLGIAEYIWRTSRDIRVVGTPGGPYVPNALHGNHYKREGVRFRWDSPPPDGHAGYPINCRCYAEPIIVPDELRLAG